MPKNIENKGKEGDSLKRPAVFILLLAALLAACGPAARPAAATLPSTATVTPAVSVLLPTLNPPTEAPPTATPEPRTLTIFAAASLTDAFTEIGHNFEAAYPGVTVTFNFAGSTTLSTQLTQGAAADVFASANHTEMDKVIAANLIQKAAPRDFLTNQLIVILPANNPANVQTMQDLARPGLKLVLGDKTLPAGKYALQILDNMVRDPSYGAGFKTKVIANVVSYEVDVKQVVAKVKLGEADAGIAYISDSVAAPDLKTIVIPTDDNVIARYPIVALNGAPQAQLASDFVTYVLSADGQAILKKWGFTPIAP
jgi:molybdate transport system substrate-binding protein